MSSGSSDGGGSRGADNVFESSQVSKTFKSYLFAGNISCPKREGDLLHSESNLRKKFRLKSDGSDSESDKKDVSLTASVYNNRWSHLKSDESHNNFSPRNSQSSAKSLQETSSAPVKRLRLKSDGTPPNSPPHNMNHLADPKQTKMSLMGKMPAGSYKVRIARYKSPETHHEEPTKYISKTVWRSSLHESNEDSVFRKDASPSEYGSKKPPRSQRKIFRMKSDENLLDEPVENKKTSKEQNGEITLSRDVRVSPTERKMMRVKSESNLLTPLTTRTVNRASLLDKEQDQAPLFLRRAEKNSKITDARYGFTRNSRNADYMDTENGYNDTGGSMKVKVRDSSPSGLSLKLDRSISSPGNSQPDSPSRLRLQERMRRRVSESDVLRDIETSSLVIDVDRNFSSALEVETAIENLQDQLKLCTDFSERRKIRAAVRKLRERKQALENCDSGSDKTPISPQEIPFVRETTPLTRVDPDLTPLNGYTDIESIPELRRLLTEETDYDEKRKIRLALRQLRQRERERESGDQPVNGRILTTNHSFIEQRQKNFVKDSNATSSSSSPQTTVGHNSNIPENGISYQNSEVILNGYDDKSHDHTPVNSQRRFSDFSGTANKKSYRRSSDASRIDEHNLVLNKDKPHHLSSPSVCRDAGSPVPKSSEVKPTFHSSLSIAHLRSSRTFSPPPKLSPPSDKSTTSSSSQSSPTTTSSRSSPTTPLSGSSPTTPLSGSSPTTPSVLQSSPVTSGSSPSTDSGNVKDIHVQRNNSLDTCQTPSSPTCGEASPKYQRRFSLSAITPKKDHVKGKEEIKQGSDFEALGKSWIEKKKRSCSLPGNSEVLNSSDMEAAFSELLSAVDHEPQNSVSTSNDLDLLVEDSKVDINENEKIEEAIIKKTATDAKSSPLSDKENSDKTLVTTPQRPHLVLDVNSTPEKNSAISIIEDDDGAVSVSSTSQKNVGDTTITQKMKLRRSESNAEEEERDTIIETKLTSPGGTYHYEKDVTKSKRKITQRGSDYFSRSKYVVRKKRDDSGEEIEEHDISLETDNFSVTKGEAWGDKAEAKVEMSKPMDTLLPPKQTSKEHVSDKAGGRMNVSKTSSGYGSVSGSDEEEREETIIIYGQQGRPSGCPEIRTTLKEVLALEGSAATLECAVTCSPLPTVTWYKDNKALSSSVRYDTKFDGPSGKASLTIKSSGNEDMGEYKCNFRNPLGEAETTSKIVIKKKATKKPEFKKRLKEQSVTEGQSVELECVLKEASTVSWYKDGIIQRNSADFKQTFDGVTAKLEISEIFLDDKGEYACVAKNDLGETKTVCKINVKETASDANVAPIFLTKPGSKILNGGDTLLLDCDVIGTPKPTISWTRDGNRLATNRGCRETYDGRVATLKISDASKDDSGKYECTAENIAGKVTVDALIVVKAKQGPPVIHHQLTDISVVVGKSVTLHCDVRGSPVPMIMWRKDGQVIGNMPDFHQTYDSNVARLTIKEIFEQDNGCYDCVARNNFGSVTSTCKLKVIDEDSAKTKMSPKLGVRNKTPQKTDWIVGRDKGQTAAPSLTPSKSTGVKRSESMRVTSDHGVRDRFMKKIDEKSAKSTSEKEEFSKVLNGLGKSGKAMDDSKDNPFKSLSNKDDEQKRVSPFRDLDKVKEKPKVDNDPPWKNVSLRRTESARVPTKPAWSRDKSEDKQAAQSDKSTQDKPKIPTGALSDSKSSTRPSLNLEKSDSVTKVPAQTDIPPRPTITLRRSESAHAGRSLFQKKDFLARAIDLAMEKSKQQEINNNRYQVVEEAPSSSSSSIPSTEKEQEKNLVKTDLSKNGAIEEKTGPTKLGRTQSARLLFENKCNSPDVKPETPLANFLARRDNGVRRTSSLKVTPAEKEAGWFRNKLQQSGPESSPLAKGDKTTMPSYETMDDEEELHKYLSKTEDFEERKRIRTRMRELREIKSKEIEERRIQREKENEDIIKRRHEQADKQKAKTLAEFDKMAKTASQQHNKTLQASEDSLKEKIRRADEDKARTLAVYDDLAQKGTTRTSTVSKTQEIPGGTRTTVIKKTETTAGFGGVGYGSKPTAEQAAKFLTEQLKNASCIGTEGKISVKTESWSSRDGVTHTSQKSEAWGAKPGAGGAMAAFKKMDSAAAPPGGSRPNFMAAQGRGGGGGSKVTRSPSAIKTMLLEWCKSKINHYEGIEVTNFSSSWNNGMAFCALIHNFYPDAFDITKLNPKNRRANFNLAFDTAEQYADIAPLLDVEDMVRMKNPDWKCVFTYVQSFYRKLHNHEANKVKQSSEQ
ncbi:LOW QUALITY PROTEIN: muscle M-line assembly protein unc-89-like [Pecten maximus]|uniref:LOW QUALITY PROTEIN: muscle M-line assembly protein unc-89-like n=1 Tax=Pecten maximus TaxID=6579 RepID=UPI00145814DB|nr:LOW QUALITY PROTEIN: muscle M-line assembly protein unc-89-like [Pecten maximus]